MKQAWSLNFHSLFQYADPLSFSSKLNSLSPRVPFCCCLFPTPPHAAPPNRFSCRLIPSVVTLFFLYFSLWPASRPWNPSPSPLYRNSTEKPPLFSGPGRRPPNPESWVPAWEPAKPSGLLRKQIFILKSPSPTFPRPQRAALQPSERPHGERCGPGACDCAVLRLRLQVLLARPQAPRKSGPKWGFPNVPSARGAFEGGSGSGLQLHWCHSSTA